MTIMAITFSVMLLLVAILAVDNIRMSQSLKEYQDSAPFQQAAGWLEVLSNMRDLDQSLSRCCQMKDGTSRETGRGSTSMATTRKATARPRQVASSSIDAPEISSQGTVDGSSGS